MARRPLHRKIADADRRVRDAAPLLPLSSAVPQVRWRRFDTSAVIEEFSGLRVDDVIEAETLAHCRKQLRTICWIYCSRREATHEPRDVRDLIDEARSSVSSLRVALGGTDPAARQFRQLVVRAMIPPHGSYLRNVVREIRRLDAALERIDPITLRAGRPSDQLGNEFVAALVPIFRSLTRKVALGRPTARGEVDATPRNEQQTRLSNTRFGSFVLAVERMILSGVSAKLSQLHPEWADVQRHRYAQYFRIRDKTAAHTPIRFSYTSNVSDGHQR